MRKEFKLTLAATISLSLLQGLDVNANTISGEVNSEAASRESAVSAALSAPSTKGTRTITGSVYGKNDNEPLIGATIQVKGQPGTGVVTDVEGNFSLTFKAVKDPVLLVSYIGYKTKEVPV
ncbi:MAG: carboxypeptidase-like regulatory domain-containing protein, partial [Muribaculaceae bacterium]|nr:carboxypeptidase-like regulatory domain-containing protein [Muribaculaceae bacterium]